MISCSTFSLEGFTSGADLEGPIQCMADRSNPVPFQIEIENLKSVIREVLREIPNSRDWLNPDLEARMRDLSEE